MRKRSMAALVLGTALLGWLGMHQGGARAARLTEAGPARADPNAARAAPAGPARVGGAAATGRRSGWSMGLRAARDVGVGPAPEERAALADAVPMALKAASGGVYRGKNGLQIEVPPGALREDAIVKFAAVNTSALPTGPLGVTAFQVVGDMGGGSLVPGAEVRVTVPVDPRVQELLARHGVAPGDFGIHTDANGKTVIATKHRADPAGRPEHVAGFQAAAGIEHVDITRCPVAPVPEEAVAAADPDPLPKAVPGLEALVAFHTEDPLVARYPPLPEAWRGNPAFQPLPAIADGEGKPMPVQKSVWATVLRHKDDAAPEVGFT